MIKDAYDEDYKVTHSQGSPTKCFARRWDKFTL